MKELIVRWYQFGAFSPVFRTHGCRQGPSEPNTKQCSPKQGSCGYNEIWSYGSDTQKQLEAVVRCQNDLRSTYHCCHVSYASHRQLAAHKLTRFTHLL